MLFWEDRLFLFSLLPSVLLWFWDLCYFLFNSTFSAAGVSCTAQLTIRILVMSLTDDTTGDSVRWSGQEDGGPLNTGQTFRIYRGSLDPPDFPLAPSCGSYFCLHKYCIILHLSKYLQRMTFLFCTYLAKVVRMSFLVSSPHMVRTFTWMAS